MNIRRIEVFMAVYKNGSVTVAADRVGLTKSAVSQTVSILEKELKTPLFIRESRKLIPTQAAHHLYSSVSPLLDSIFNVYNSIANQSTETMGTLSIGAPPDLTSKLIIPCLAEFYKVYTGVKFQLQLGTPFTLGDLLVKNHIDFAIFDAADVFEKLYPVSTTLLTREKHVLVASRKYFTKKSRVFTYEMFCGEKFVSHKSDAIEVKFWCKHHFKKVPRNLEVTLVVDQVAAIKSAILSHFGFGLLPERLVEQEIKSGALVVWPTATQYENKIAVAQLSGKKPPKIEKLVINFIFKYFERNRLSII